jgi:hypothetical protein
MAIFNVTIKTTRAPGNTVRRNKSNKPPSTSAHPVYALYTFE